MIIISNYLKYYQIDSCPSYQYQEEDIYFRKLKLLKNLIESPELDIIEFAIPSYIESLDFSTITSEALAINCAYVSQIISDFTQDENLVPTISGRMSSQSFNFNIRQLGKEDSFLHVDVQNAQIEIDGGYEGVTSLNLIEAKNNLSSDF